jgi:secreted PhoX family phosphatase
VTLPHRQLHREAAEKRVELGEVLDRGGLGEIGDRADSDVVPIIEDAEQVAADAAESVETDVDQGRASSTSRTIADGSRQEGTAGIMRSMTSGLDRRRFLGIAAGLAVAGPLEAFARAGAGAFLDGGKTRGYGRLAPTRDEETGLALLALPPGFRYHSFSWTGDPMFGGEPTPSHHDGMAAFAAGHGRIRLVRNHEVRRDTGAFAAQNAYDAAAGGGTTTLELDATTARPISVRPSLSGTIWNCAGGPTPWGSWLTCEETVLGPGEGNLRKTHGWVFEVPSAGVATPVPLEAMGRFVHEAVAVDPSNSIVYETEDRGDAGLYRYVPSVPRALGAGGRLEMLAVDGRPGLDLRRGVRRGEEIPVSWVVIDDARRAHRDPGEADTQGVFSQGAAKGGARFARLEGAWFGEGRLVFTSTSGGEAQRGQVWQLDPERSRLTLLYESPGEAELDGPDNICVSPRGGLVICEDGAREQFLRALTRNGRPFAFARNNLVLRGERNGIAGDFTDQEFAGACFSPDGEWLFVNIQTPGITFAITGPWRDGGI